MFQGTLGVKFVVLGLGSTILILFYFFCIKVVKLGTKFNNFAPKVGFCQPDVLMMTITCPVVSTRWNLWQFPRGSRWPVQPGCSRCLGALGQQPKNCSKHPPFFVVGTKYSKFLKNSSHHPFTLAILFKHIFSSSPKISLVSVETVNGAKRMIWVKYILEGIGIDIPLNLFTKLKWSLNRRELCKRNLI